MLANVDEDALLRMTRELATARTRLSQIEKVIEMVGEKDAWDALVAQREAREAA